MGNSKYEKIADEQEVELIDSYEGEEYQEPFEDDGYLHVMEGSTRYAFDVGENQSLSNVAQNRNTRRVMKALGLPVTDRVLV